MTGSDGSTAGEIPGGVRIDKWLWAARMFKTRSAASAACDAGHVDVNELKAKASTKVRPGDRVEARTPRGKVVLVVKALAERRGPVGLALSLYEDETPQPSPEELAVPKVLRDRGTGRPTKRDRRALRRFKER